MKTLKPWYNFFGGRYVGDQPSFYNKDELPWVSILEENWKVIKAEVTSLAENNPGRLRPYFINRSMSFPPRKWQTMGLYFWNFVNKKNCSSCPETVRIMRSIPGLISCSLSVLEPGSNINPHQGDTDAIIRCHLGLTVPCSLPECGFQVGKEIRSWEEGKALPFCDARTHTAWNNCDKRRLILIVDVIRPEFVKKKNAVCAHVLAYSIIQMLYERFPFLGNQSGYFKRSLYHFFRGMVRLILPIQRLTFK